LPSITVVLKKCLERGFSSVKLRDRSLRMAMRFGERVSLVVPGIKRNA
jgi:hypothetical protein